MGDPRMERLAATLVQYCVAVRPGDWVVVHGHVLAVPLVSEVVRHVLQAGGHPTVMLSDDAVSEALLEHASEDQLRWISPVDTLVSERVDCSIRIGAAANTRTLSGIDPNKQQRRQHALC